MNFIILFQSCALTRQICIAAWLKAGEKPDKNEKKRNRTIEVIIMNFWVKSHPIVVLFSCFTTPPK
ncbi:MAG TPA: hypothetical protein VJT83_04785, partial [Chitinophagaceae bacterium]|nr:hypothetical protein [Chitinophagaceae bacterium]